MSTFTKLAERHKALDTLLMGDGAYRELREIEQTVRTLVRYEPVDSDVRRLLEQRGLVFVNAEDILGLPEPRGRQTGRASSNGARPATTLPKKARRRAKMPPAQRKAVSARMLKYWAGRRKAGRPRKSAAKSAAPATL